MTDIEAYKIVQSKLEKTYVAKNHDYGDSCHKTYQEFGMTSFLVRLCDKLNRAITLSKTGRLVDDESLQDTLMDMANYAMMACVELEKPKTRTIEDKD